MITDAEIKLQTLPIEDNKYIKSKKDILTLRYVLDDTYLNDKIDIVIEKFKAINNDSIEFLLKEYPQSLWVGRHSGHAILFSKERNEVSEITLTEINFLDAVTDFGLELVAEAVINLYVIKYPKQDEENNK